MKLRRLMAPEGDPTPSGGGSPAPAQPSAPAPASPAPAPSPAFSPEAIQALAAQLVAPIRDSVMAEVRRSGALGGRKPDPAPTPAPTGDGHGAAPQPAPSPAPSGVTPQDILRVASFGAVAAEYGLTPRTSEMLLGEFMTARPTDVRAWMAEQTTSLGVVKASPVNPNPTPGPSPGHAASPTPTVTPTPTPGGPPPAPSAGQFRAPVIRWSQAELDAYAAKNGGPAAVTRLFVEDMATTRFALPRKT